MQAKKDIAWGKRNHVVLDVGCGVASFGEYLFDRDVLTMSCAPKDEHEAQVQFALETGIPAISAVMGTKRLPFPGRVFDVVHCARCRVVKFCWNWTDCCVLAVTSCGLLLLYTRSCPKMLRYGKVLPWFRPHSSEAVTPTSLSVIMRFIAIIRCDSTLHIRVLSMLL
ncbi:probable methyltransferase PMT27 isoform X5 [Phragmites australis]|uniref:probable methyltransferase PMT27 isoform X5 n=1 Tax=Phragmites australis TaxID=29695 RepID=UPI002D77030B|nr:probable methyltransferase PMT27 isoform X5 [Phragmites australis]